MKKFEARDFSTFFRAIYGFDPFPWQSRLIEQLAIEKRWPRSLALPTASGKTSTIDIAVFSLACELAASVERRAMPTRIVFVVDRRIIVDAAYERALKLSEAIQTSNVPIVRAVRDALASVAVDEFAVLHVERLRGGVPRERDWVPSPSHPTVLLSTVDQVGSRLLFRGYGVSESMRPVHAGLLGGDALILLDEVHLSEPFRQTLRSVDEMRGSVHLPWAAVDLSATPRGDGDRKDVFALNGDDMSHPVLRSRLTAPKPAMLVDAHDDDPKSLADRFVNEALTRSSHGGGNGRILIIVNRVALARLIYERLRTRINDDSVSIDLLIGRAREIDADLRRKNVIDRTGSRPSTDANAELPYFLVATQTVEAGADVDFDVLVTQIASLDALRQRFGRVDRVGYLAGHGRYAQAAIIATRQEIAKGNPDPIYEDALRTTWHWLRENIDSNAEIDFGINAMQARLEKLDLKQVEVLTSAAVDAPTLMPSYVRILEQTRPTPKPDLPIELFLHGPNTQPADVSIVWRGDLSVRDLRDEQRVAAILDALPPRAAEALPLPIWIVRRWLTDRRLRHPAPRDFGDIGDVAGRQDERNDTRRYSDEPAAWRWNGNGNAEAVRPNSVRPGDVLVVPAEYGGCDEFGWSPDYEEAVTDVADAAALPYVGSSFAVRINPLLLRNEIARDGRLAHDERLDVRVDVAWHSLLRAVGSETAPRDIVERCLNSGQLPPDGATARALKLCLDALQSAKNTAIHLVARFPYGTNNTERGNGILIIAPRGLPVATKQRKFDYSLEAVTEDDERSAITSRRYSLIDHSHDVERYARLTASHLRLPSELVDDIALSGWLHDAGKSDLRFQRYLLGSRWNLDTELLAKSLEPRDRHADRRAKEVAALPDHWRHEALSVRVARAHPRFSEANDPECVLWLIGVHHGWGRPLFPHGDPLDGQARTIETVDGCLQLTEDYGPNAPEFGLPVVSEDGVIELSWPALGSRLSKRYGPWTLALFETIVRLADHRASAARSRAGAR